MKCFWCQSDEAELSVFANRAYAPCTPCMRRMSGGTPIIEVTVGPQDPLQVGLILDVDKVVYPTGRWAVAEPGWEPLSHLRQNQLLEEQGYCFVTPDVWEAVGLEEIHERQGGEGDPEAGVPGDGGGVPGGG